VRLDLEGAAPLAADALRRRAAARLPAGPAWAPAHAALDRLAAAGPSVDWAEVVGALAAALQEERLPTTYRYHVQAAPQGGVAAVLIEADEGEVARLSTRLAIEIAAALVGEEDAAPGLDGTMRAFERERARVRFDWTTRLLVDAARARGIPVMKPLRDSSMAVLGQGRWRRRFRGTSTDSTSFRAARIAKDKHLTNRLLAASFVPVPAQRWVRSRAELDAAVAEIGFPLVVKGRTVDKGAAVTTGLTSADEIPAAVAKVRAQHDEVLLERQIAGDSYRFTIVAGRVVSVERRTPAQVVGDGAHSIEELVAIENERRRQGGRYDEWLELLTLAGPAANMLARAGLGTDNVPGAGEVVRLSGAANMSTGGLTEDVTAEACPALVRLAERVARIVGLDIAGIDLVTPDLTRPLAEAGGAVVEVNTAPGLRRLGDTRRPSPDVAGAILDYLFPAPRRGRIPTVGVTGTNGKTTTCRMVARMLEQAGLAVGLVTTSGVTIAGETVAVGDLAGGRAAEVVLQDPRVEAAVLELARGGILRAGLRIEDLEVGVVTNISEDHIGQDGIRSLADLARIKRVVVEVARRAAVLNADDALCRAMAGQLKAPVWWVSQAPGSGLVETHLRCGGDAVLLEARDGAPTILHRCGDSEAAVIAVAAIPATLGGIAVANIENALFATAAGLAAGVALEHVRAALATFDNSFAMSGGRLNIRDVDGVRVILDYVHNVDGLEKLGRTLRAMPVSGRRIAYLGHVDTRPDSFYASFGAAAAAVFDRFVIAENRQRAGRPPGEVSRLIGDGIRAAGVPAGAVTLAPTRDEAVALALAMARRGDLVFINGNGIDGQWERILAWAPG
jgi:cyanophycin synthetase